MPDINQMITLRAYAAMHGRYPSSVLRRIRSGAIQSAVHIGTQWLIDRDEPWPPDGRIKSGRYIGWKAKRRELQRKKGG